MYYLVNIFSDVWYLAGGQWPLIGSSLALIVVGITTSIQGVSDSEFYRHSAALAKKAYQEPFPAKLHKS